MQFKHLTATLSIIFIFLVAAFWFFVINKTPKISSKPLVVCTTTIIGDTIKQIAQGTIDLEILMGPGVDPHLYKPIEQDVYKISQAHIIFYNGLHLEARMGELFAKMATIKKTVAVTKDIPQDFLIKSTEHADFTDPHVWFDPRLWSYAIETITCVLQENSPQHHDFYEENKKEFLEKLNALYFSTRADIQRIPLKRRILITGHDAFSYFAQAYDCKVVSLQGISTASEAGTKDVQHLVHFIYKHKIPTIFVETSVPSRNIQALQQGVSALGFNVCIGDELYSDALGSPSTEQGTYLGMLQSNVDAIVHGLLR
ncbi:MAG: zinc ABC transporter substrate-binding protein [Candidatus Dependentiae bacterium]|nr:zinc ABC transporter substrate-binding protein [Candidatus Dependentiae bacterium]